MTPDQTTLTKIVPLLAALGFRKRAGQILTIDIADDVLGWLGLNRATQGHTKGHFSINPVVGVRHGAVERVVAECRGEKFHEYIPATISTSLGYLLPEAQYRSWDFGGETTDVVAADLANNVATYGLLFMRETASLSALCQAFEERRGLHEHQLTYRRPVAWLLAGSRARARQIVDESLAKLGHRTDPAADEYRRFADKFVAFTAGVVNPT
jgi:hypothetical protein